jgi:hypothetical protein
LVRSPTVCANISEVVREDVIDNADHVRKHISDPPCRRLQDLHFTFDSRQAASDSDHLRSEICVDLAIRWPIHHVGEYRSEDVGA